MNTFLLRLVNNCSKMPPALLILQTAQLTTSRLITFCLQMDRIDKYTLKDYDFYTFLENTSALVAARCSRIFEEKVFSSGTKIYTKTSLFSRKKEVVEFTFEFRKHKRDIDWIDIRIDVKDTRFLETIKTHVVAILAPQICTFLEGKGRFYYYIKIKQDAAFWYGEYVGVPRSEYT